MPYVSPNGTIQSTKNLPMSSSAQKRGAALPPRVDSPASMEHGEGNSMDMSIKAVRRLEGWKGWDERRLEKRNTEIEGPLGEKTVHRKSAANVSMTSVAEDGKGEQAVVDVVEVIDVPDA